VFPPLTGSRSGSPLHNRTSTFFPGRSRVPGGDTEMGLLVVRTLFVALAVLGPWVGADSRVRGGWTPTEPGQTIWPDRPVAPDRPARTPFLQRFWRRN